MEATRFDFVVVGGGAAGCVMAARLAGAGVGSVLLLEAGPDLRGDLPEALRDGWHLPRPPDWGFTADHPDGGDPQPLRRGRLLGGTSWLTRFGIRGSPAEFDEWAELGNAGWSFDEVLPYFRRLERDVEFGDRPWHGDSGPIPITRYPDLEQTETLATASAAAEAAGFRSVDDHNEPDAVGIGRMPMSSVDGLRVTATAYLDLVDDRDALVIRPDEPVDRVVVDGNRATGVRLVGGTAIAAGTVVLAAGTYGTPLILMRSGIGTATDLTAFGIEVHADLPGVGGNLRDHPSVEIETACAGPARAAPLLHAIATFRSRSTETRRAHDLMLWFADPGSAENPPQVTIEAVLLRPEARGRVRLRSSDPSTPPRIDLPVTTDGDVDRIAEAVQRAVDVAAHPLFRDLCAGDPQPPPTVRDELHAFIRENSYSIPHVVGTCAMGPRPEDGAVVDANGRVHGFDNLFVADASIIPEPVSGFSHLPTLMVAERISEVVAGS